MAAWRTLQGASAAELRPAHTLLNGQCFGWRPHDLREKEYIGVIGNRVIAIRQVVTGQPHNLCRSSRALIAGSASSLVAAELRCLYLCCLYLCCLSVELPPHRRTLTGLLTATLLTLPTAHAADTPMLAVAD